MVENKLYPLTHPQQRIWYTEKLHPGTSMWNNAGTLKITGALDLTLMTKSINLFIKNNEAMRIRITEVEGKPFQYVCPFVYSSFDYLDFSGKGLQGLYEWDSAQTQSYLPLLDKQLFYIAIASLGENEFVWYAKVHHIISDAWSLVMFSNQVMEYYDAFLAGGEPEAVPGGSYTGFIERENEYLRSRRFEQDKQSFNEMFEDSPEPTVLKQKKTNYTSTRARRKAGIIPKTVADRMRAYCVEKNVSIFPLFLAALSIYINRILNKDDIVIGVPVFNRSKEERSTVGMFVSTVPIRIRVPEEASFDEFARMVLNEWFRVLKHQRYPYELLLADLRKKHKGLESLYDITLSYQNVQFEKDTKNISYEGRWHFSGNQVNSLSIHINDREGEGSLILDYDHLVPLFSIKEIEYIHSHCMNILTDAIAHPGKKLYELDVMSPEELGRVMVEFNANKADYTLDRGLDALFSQRMKKTPDEIALIAGTDVLTYRQLNALVNKAARFLKEKGVGREDIVGIVISRDVSLIVFILAAIRAGAAFLPIDPEFPCDRVTFELKESRAKCVVASPCLLDKCGGACEAVSTDVLDSLPECADEIESNNHMDDLAYVIYTSGSTGIPKGVMVEQRSLLHYILAVSDIMDFSSGSVVLSATTVSFDIFIMETFPTLLNGGTVVLAGENEHNIPRNLVELMVLTRVTSILTTPSRMQLILTDKGADECLKNMREIMLGGDVLQKSLLLQLQEKTPARILHFYGPTEITIGATYKDVTESGTVNIGRPLPDVYTYILDKHQNPVPIGVHGELYVGGIGVSRGYLNRPDLTAASFVDNPFRPGERMYRTGDITRWFPMGEIEFLGRVDQQVKIRGFRIELGEIEARLLKISGINACAVADRTDENGRKYLCAYICGDRGKSIARIRSKLARELPAYMMPSYFIWMDTLPLNASGKVDKNRLPEPVLDELHVGRDDFEPLSTATQKALAEIWKDVLKVSRISGTDNFFDIGGDSLLIVMVSAEVYKRFRVEVSLEDVYQEPTLENYARLIDEEMEKTDSRPILPVRGKRDYPVSAAQRQIFIVSGGFLAQTTAYNIAGAYHIKGKLDIPALERAFIKLIARNESLRTAFEMKKGALRQKIVKKADFILHAEDCDKKDVSNTLKSLVRPFDLASPPLFRAALLKTGADEFVLFMDVHHIVADGTSGELILSQLSRLYAGKNIPVGGIGYKDYSVWQADYLDSDHAAVQRRFWMERLKGDLPTLNLHTDYPRTAAFVPEGGRLHFSIPRDMTLKLRTLTQRSGTTMFMLLLSLYTVFLSKYTGQKDIIVGVPASVRNRHELMDIVGMFVNTLPMRNRIDADEKFTELLERVRADCIEAFRNQTYPFESMVSDMKLERDPGRNPVFGTMLSYNTFDLSSIDLKDLKTKVTLVSQPVSKFDITFEIYDKSTTLSCEFEYAAKLFKKETMQGMVQHFKNMVGEILENPDVLVGKIGLLSPAEQEKILVDFNRTSHGFIENIPLIRLFEQKAEEYPEKTAVICGREKMTYAELDRAASSCARRLKEQGVKRGHIVGVCVHRSFDLMCAILGTLKTGAAYMPVDPFYPEERKDFMLKDSGATVLITDQSGKYNFEGKTILTRDINQYGPGAQPDIASEPDDRALVIYTSGSTGRPKGAMLTVKGILNFVQLVGKEGFYSENTAVASVSSVSFDMFLSDSVVSLFFGATVLLMNEDECRQPHLLAPAMREKGATFLQTTPSRMQILMNYNAFRENLAGLRLIVLGGEPVPPDLLKNIKRHTRARILNVYGPTETTVYSSIKDLTHTSKITIGRPILNMQYYILDADMLPVPVGCPGELYISGKGVSLGYVNRADLTMERYLKNPYTNDVMYKTGDICTFLPSGEVLYLGRADFQVKLRGLRIELGEIESAILDFSGIEKAAVMPFGKEKEQYLCAYFTANRAVDEALLRESLAKRLPVYMIPSYFIELDRFPMTPGGKLERKALPEPERSALGRKKALPKRTAMNDTQKKWRKSGSRF
jgi:fengycin family lipopeptide synthetase D